MSLVCRSVVAWKRVPDLGYDGRMPYRIAVVRFMCSGGRVLYAQVCEGRKIHFHIAGRNALGRAIRVACFHEFDEIRFKDRLLRNVCGLTRGGSTEI